MEPEHLRPPEVRSFLAAGEWAPRSGSTLNANFGGCLLLATPSISSRRGSRAERGELGCGRSAPPPEGISAGSARLVGPRRIVGRGFETCRDATSLSCLEDVVHGLLAGSCEAEENDGLRDARDAPAP